MGLNGTPPQIKGVDTNHGQYINKAKFRIGAITVPIAIAVISGTIGFSVNKILENRFFSKEAPFQISDTIEYFPLAVGNSWHYQGTFRGYEIVDGSSKFGEGKYTVEIKIDSRKDFESYGHKYILFSGIRTNIRDIFGTETIPVAFVVASNKVDIYYGGYSITLVNRLAADPVNYQLTDEDYKNLWDVHPDSTLEFPLQIGLLIGGSYLIGDPPLTVVAKTRRATPIFSATCFELSQEYAGSNSETTFCPKVGITRTTYKHFGTIEEYQLDLTQLSLATN